MKVRYWNILFAILLAFAAFSTALDIMPSAAETTARIESALESAQ